MAAVLGIVKSHRGALKVSSVEGRGTTFELLLPPAVAEATATKEEVADASDDLPPGRRVLIIEDEDDVREVAASMLRKWGCETRMAGDGEAGVELFAAEEGAFDLVLLDLTMPGLNGFEAAERIRARRPKTKILLVSGYDESGATAVAGQPAIDGFVQKPYRWGQLKAKLAELLG